MGTAWLRGCCLINQAPKMRGHGSLEVQPIEQRPKAEPAGSLDITWVRNKLTHVTETFKLFVTKTRQTDRIGKCYKLIWIQSRSRWFPREIQTQLYKSIERSGLLLLVKIKMALWRWWCDWGTLRILRGVLIIQRAEVVGVKAVRPEYLRKATSFSVILEIL